MECLTSIAVIINLELNVSTDQFNSAFRGPLMDLIRAIFGGTIFNMETEIVSEHNVIDAYDTNAKTIVSLWANASNGRIAQTILDNFNPAWVRTLKPKRTEKGPDKNH